MSESGSQPAFLRASLRGTAGSLKLDVAFALRASWTVLFGPSGAGKSTVLRALCGLTGMREQSVMWNGEDVTAVPPHRRRFAMVAQQTALFPHRTVLNNVIFALRTRSDLPRTARIEEGHRLLARFHAGDLADRYPRTLSGGEGQRVALARAVASSPRLLLLDEAFTGLERHLQTGLIAEVKQWQQDTGVPVISVTHDVSEALACADEVLRIVEGRIVAQGSATSVLADERAALLHRLRDAG